MPADSLWVTIRDDLVDALDTMSIANGFHHDYGEVVKGGIADWMAETDFERPNVYLEWQGTAAKDLLHGDEQAAGRHRHHDLFIVSVAVKDDEGDHQRKANRIRQDVHKALLTTDTTLSLARNRGLTRTTTFDGGVPSWESFVENGKPLGGVLQLNYVVRWDHTTGDMSDGG